MMTTEGPDRRQGRRRMMPGAVAVFLGLGFSAVVCQTLLFREFLAAFGGSELGVGSFFGSWLTWVALGALASRFVVREEPGVAGTWVDRHFHAAILSYIPAFLIQFCLIANARSLAGVQSYELFPYVRMAGFSLLVNAPVSFVTGLLFAGACRWAARTFELPVARVYVMETLGAFGGGIFITALLAWGVRGETAFLLASILLTGVAASAGFTGGRRDRRRGGAWGCAVGTALVTGSILLGADEWWASHNDRAAWGRLLPVSEFQGRFSTAQATYLYGEREGQFVVVASGGVCEALPDKDHASEVVALNIAQCPAARRVLVMGPGSLATCLRLLELPTIEEVTWLHPDPQYALCLREVLPPDLREAADRIVVPAVDARAYLSTVRDRYDLAILSLPDVTTLVLNRYATVEFFTLMKQRLAKDGAVSVRVSGPANYVSPEISYLGASALRTLESVFTRVAIKPGDESWLIASDGDGPTESPGELRERFTGVKGADAVYPAAAVLSLYPPDRIAFQREAYAMTVDEAGDRVLVNNDGHPKALLFNLALALNRATGVSIAGSLPALLSTGVWLGLLATGLFGGLRFVYRRAGAAADVVENRFDIGFLVFAAGLAAMSLSIVLMLSYQSRFGSLFLDVGMVTSLFMLGSFLGGAAAEHVAKRHSSRLRLFLGVCMICHLAPVLLVMTLPLDATRLYCALLFVMCGVFGGVYFPVAAHRLQAAHVARNGTKGVVKASSTLELLDHLGGAGGAVLTGLGLLPLLGVSQTLWLLYAAVLAAGGLALTRSGRRAARADAFDLVAKPAGYVVVGIAAFALAASRLLSAAHAGEEGERLLATARSMVGTQALSEARARLSDGDALSYLTVGQTGEGVEGYVFATRPLAGAVAGYGGPVGLTVYVGAEGTLHKVQLAESNETPAYVERLRGWFGRLVGRNLFDSTAFEDIDAASGATLTSEAVLEALEVAGPRFASEILGMEVAQRERPRRGRGPDRGFWVLAALTAVAIVLRHRPNRWVRRAFLAAALVVAGVWLNLQYSSQQVFSLLSLDLPMPALDGAFFLVVVMPIVVVLFGNVYCGYVCPFGALSELVGDLRSSRTATDPEKRVWRYGRAMKYLLWLLLAVLFATTRDSSVLASDPLITVFGTARDRFVTATALVLVLAGLFYRRFWCRNLCPAGAFLALVGGLQLLRRLSPATEPAKCDLGVISHEDLDCIRCDRCRMKAKAEPSAGPRRGSPVPVTAAFLTSVFVCAAVFAALMFGHAEEATGFGQGPAARTSGVAGQPRDVDLPRIKGLIDHGALSNKEAEFYLDSQGRQVAPAGEAEESELPSETVDGLESPP